MWPVAVAVLAQGTSSIYVSVDGDDSWSGRVARPERTHRDGPLRSLSEATLRARAIGAQTIYIEPGVYRMNKPTYLTKADSNRTFAVYGRGVVHIEGSRRIAGWRVDAKGWWHARLPGVAEGVWNFEQLWVDGNRRYRPRASGGHYATIAGRAAPSAAAEGKGFDRFVYEPGALNPKWHNLNDVEILAVHLWTMARMRIRSIDDASRTVTFTGSSPSTADWSAFAKGGRYIVENVREALGKPGDWYLDRPTGELVYVPTPGEDPASTDVEAPIVDRLIVLDGADRCTFSNLRFEYTNWVTPDSGHDFPQADIDVSAALSFHNAEHVALSHCTVAHTGGYAIDFGAGCYACSASNCVLTDLGTGGVKIGTTAGVAGAPAVASVENCRIVSGGRVNPAGVGVWIGDAGGNVVAHNEIRDFYYTGVSVGWTWGYGVAHSGGNTIANNEISHIGQHVLSDMGGIYTLGNQTGTRLDGNIIHDVSCAVYGGWGIYPDEGTTNEQIVNNVVYRCQSAGFHQHYGMNNEVRNNIFALNGDFEIMRTRAEDHLSFTFDHNVIAWAGGQPFGSNWTGTGFRMAGNLYWHYGGLVAAPIQEPGARVADPEFVDPFHGNFRLRRRSPALRMGFEPISAGTCGPRGHGAPGPVKATPPAFPTT